MILTLLVLLQAPAHYRHHGPALLPDSVYTPGKVARTDLASICGTSTTTVRHTSERLKEHIRAEYGVPLHPRVGTEEVDHLVPLELGGADDSLNLWAQPQDPRPGFREKDLLENVLHRLACRKQLPLDSVQRGIARDWYAMYRRYVMGVP